jgi:His-Xaa-Ser system protein HxsD
MKKIKINRTKKSLKILIPQALYSKEAILNCLYWHLDKPHVQFSLTSDENYLVSINATNLSLLQIENIENTFTNELIDFELREIVSRETTNIKELIIAKAFANGALDNFT